MTNKIQDFNFNNRLSPLQEENSMNNEREFLSKTSKLTSYPRRLFITLDNTAAASVKHDNSIKTFNLRLMNNLSPAMQYTEELILITKNPNQIPMNLQPALEFADEYNINKSVTADIATLGELSPWIFQYSVGKVNIFINPYRDFTDDMSNIIPAIRNLVVRKYFAPIKPVINLVYLLTTTDVSMIPDMLRLPFETEADEISTVFKNTSDSGSYTLNESGISLMLKQLREKADYYGIGCKEPYTNDSLYLPYSAWSDLHMGHDGCIRWLLKDEKITTKAPVPEALFINDIWNSPELTALREEVISGCDYTLRNNQFNHIF